MSFTDIKKFTIELFLKLPRKNIGDVFKTLLNKVEEQENKIKELLSEIQNLRDEVNRLKDEKGKPVIPKNKEDKKGDDDKM